MKRITKKDLENMVDLLNATKRPEGKMYGIDYAYGGYSIVLIDEHGGKTFLGQRVGAKEVYNTLCTIRNLLEHLEGWGV